MAAVMAFSMTGCNMGQSNTVTTAEETNVKIRQLRRGQPIQVRSPKCQPHPSRWRQKRMVKWAYSYQIVPHLSVTEWVVWGENIQTPPDGVDQGTVYVQGSGDATVTVESYSTDVDTSGAAAADSWSEYAVEKA